MLKPTLRLLSKETPYIPPTTSTPSTPYINRYRAKKTWPPDFTLLSQKHQFRLERRYRRRAKLKWARPTWTKFVKLSTWATVGFVAVYGVLFMETPETENIGKDVGVGGVFDGVRGWVGRFGAGIFEGGVPTRRVEGEGKG